MTVTTGFPITLSSLRNELNLGNNLLAYRRNGALSNYLVGASNFGSIRLSSYRGAWASGPYININYTVGGNGFTVVRDSIGVTPSLPTGTASIFNGTSNNGDPTNAYVFDSFVTSGNRGYATSTLVYYLGASSNGFSVGMRFNHAIGGIPWQSAFEDSNGNWVNAIGLNYHSVDVGGTANADIIQYVGNSEFYFATLGVNFFDLFDGNNFYAQWVSGGVMYHGLLNRAQLRSGNISPTYQLAMYGPEAAAGWRSSLTTLLHSYSELPSGGGSINIYLGCDEILLRGHQYPSDHRMANRGRFVTRSIYRDAARRGTIEGRAFE